MKQQRKRVIEAIILKLFELTRFNLIDNDVKRSFENDLIKKGYIEIILVILKKFTIIKTQ